MSRIEEEMVDAIKSHNSFSKGHTTVHIDANTAHVFLHGNHIASVVNHGKVMVNLHTLKEYSTNTTKSRLRALGVDICTKQGVIFINGKEI